MAEKQGIALRRWLASIFEGEEPRSRASHLFDALLAILIIANVTAVVLESVEPIHRHLAVPFDLFEHAATLIFAVEYVLRVWSCVDFPGGNHSHPVWGRLRYMRSFFALVDLMSVLPAILGVLGAADLRVLRLLRLLRMLKLVRHSTTFSLLWSVLREEMNSIAALLFILLLTVTISGALMYLIESDEQPAVFTSIPVAMWWAIETLTTVGYGDMVPMTAAGRVLGSLVSIIGIGTLALFSGLITIGFLDQLKHYREDHPVRRAVDKASARRHAEPQYGDGKLAPVLQQAAAGEPIDVHHHAGHGVCPHCGFALSIHEAPHPPVRQQAS